MGSMEERREEERNIADDISDGGLFVDAQVAGAMLRTIRKSQNY